jgi:hypothetical protein
VPLSLVDKVLTDNCVQGARLAIKDNNQSGAFLGQSYELIEDIVPKDGDVIAKAKEILAKRDAIIVADLEAKDLLGVADLPEAKNSIIFRTWKVIKKIHFEVPGVRAEQLQPVGMEFTKDGNICSRRLTRGACRRHKPQDL